MMPGHAKCGGYRVIGDKKFAEHVGDMLYGSDDEPAEAVESEEEVNPEAPEESAPEEESPDEPDKPEAEPATEEDTEPDVEEDDQVEAPETDEPEVEPEDTEGEPEDESPEEPPEDEEADLDVDDTDDDADELDLPDWLYYNEEDQLVAEVDGEEVPADELPQGYLRQADYTRKTQELAREREQVQQARQIQQELVREMNAHDGMRDFLSEHPEAMEFFLAQPADTQRLMRNRADFEEFVQDYELLQERPEIAEAYLRSSEESGESEAEQQLRVQRMAQQYQGFANELDAAIVRIAEDDEYAEYIEEEDVKAVMNRVMDIGGFGPDSGPDEVLQGLNRLANVFVTPDGEHLDMGLVIDRFDLIKEQKLAEIEEEEEAAEEHNKQVDAELEEQKKRTPSTPDDTGGGPAPEPERGPQHEDLHGVLSSLRGD